MGNVHRVESREGSRTIVAVATPKEKRLIPRFLDWEDYDKVVITGVGGTNVVRSLRAYPQDTHIINIGFAGSATIPKGEVVRVKDVSLYHPNCEYEEPVMQISDEGVHCYTSCDFVGDKERENSVFDMELAFIAALGFLKVDSIKVVSDSIDYEEYEQTISTL
jgi:hypothetical protein